MKKFSLFFFLLFSISVFGQKKINIDANDTKMLNLSEIAEEVVLIPLEAKISGIQYVLLSREYLFVALMGSIVQYDSSGKFIRNISCDGYVYNISADTLKKELYVTVRDKLQCYDFSGKLKRTYTLANPTTSSIFFHQGNVWILSYQFQPDRSTNYRLSCLHLEGVMLI
jgi:hypothetical protein